MPLHSSPSDDMFLRTIRPAAIAFRDDGVAHSQHEQKLAHKRRVIAGVVVHGLGEQAVNETALVVKVPRGLMSRQSCGWSANAFSPIPSLCRLLGVTAHRRTSFSSLAEGPTASSGNSRPSRFAAAMYASV